MKRSYLLIAIVLLATVFHSCSLHLGLTEGLDPEVTELLGNPSLQTLQNEAPAVILLKEYVVEIFSDGDYRLTFREVTKVLSEEGRVWTDVRYEYDKETEKIKLLYAKTVTPEGKVIPIQRDAVQVVAPESEYPKYTSIRALSFTMPGITIGSIVDYKVLIESKGQPEEFSERFFFQVNAPVLLVRCKVIMPQHKELKYVVFSPPPGVDTSPKIVEKAGKRIYLWEFKNIPASLPEEDMPPREEVCFNIYMTTAPDWNTCISRWKKLIAGKTDPDEVIKQKAKELTKSLKSWSDKVKEIFDYVKTEITFVHISLDKAGYEPAPAYEVFKNRYGDCKDKSTLLISMLRAVGIKAYYALVVTKDSGDLVEEIPTIYQFDHCIVAVEKEGGGYLFLDPTAKFYPFGHLPYNVQGQKVLVVREKDFLISQVPTADPWENLCVKRQFIEIKPDGSIRGRFTIEAYGNYEALFRSIFAAFDPTEIREAFELILARGIPGAKLIDYTCPNPLKFDESFTLRGTFEVREYCQKARDILIFPLPSVFWSFSEPIEEERRYSLQEIRRVEKDIVEFTVPQDYEVYYLPKPVRIETPFFEFRSSYQSRDGKICYHAEMVQKAFRVMPKEYPKYKKYWEEMTKKKEAFVVFVKE